MHKPLIVDYFDFDNIKHEKYLTNKKETFSLKCKYCSKEIRASFEVTSNWVSHIKTIHIEKFKEYEIRKKGCSKETVIFFDWPLLKI